MWNVFFIFYFYFFQKFWKTLFTSNLCSHISYFECWVSANQLVQVLTSGLTREVDILVVFFFAWKRLSADTHQPQG